jgi:hypothetical protein
MDTSARPVSLRQVGPHVITASAHRPGIVRARARRPAWPDRADSSTVSAQLGVAEPAAAFTVSAALFGCADWTVADGAGREGFVATARRCLLCAMVKKAGGASPCRLYGLDPIEGTVEGLAPGAGFDVQETLSEGAECRVRVRN